MTTEYFTITSESDREQIEAAAAILRRGGLLAIPTETVYGLGADGLNEDAVRRIFEAKGRPQDNPLILHVPSADWLARYCEDVPEAAYRLAERFWPGPLTMILKKKPVVPLRTTGGLETVGMRCPDHAVTRAIIAAAGVPVAAPSANVSGRPSCTTAEHVRADMDGRIDGVVDGGACRVGVESTIRSDLRAAAAAASRRAAAGGAARRARRGGGGSGGDAADGRGRAPARAGHEIQTLRAKGAGDRRLRRTGGKRTLAARKRVGRRWRDCL